MIDRKNLYLKRCKQLIFWQRLDITALALGIDGVERQRGLSRAAETGNDRQRVAWNLDVDIFQVVLPCPVHGDAIEHCAGIPIVP